MNSEQVLLEKWRTLPIDRQREVLDFLDFLLSRPTISPESCSSNPILSWQQEKAFIESIRERPSLPDGRDWTREDLYD
jgi:hypothetical protein